MSHLAKEAQNLLTESMSNGDLPFLERKSLLQLTEEIAKVTHGRNEYAELSVTFPAGHWEKIVKALRRQARKRG